MARPSWYLRTTKLRDRLVEVAYEKRLPPRRVDAALDELRSRPGADLSALDLGREESDLSLRAPDTAHRTLEQLLALWRGEGRAVTILCGGESNQLIFMAAP